MTTPAPNPLAPFIAPLMSFETGTLDGLLQPFFAPLSLDAQGPMTALDKLLTGQTPEFLKPFNIGGTGLPPFPFPLPPGFPPAPGNGTAAASRAATAAASRAAQARAAAARAAAATRGQDTSSRTGLPGAATAGRMSTRTGYR